MEPSRVPTRLSAATKQPAFRHALVLADSAALRTLMALSLRRENLEVAASRHDGDLRFVNPPDLVLIGPSESSVDIAERIGQLANSLHQRPVIVAVVTDDRREYQESLLSAGADRVVTMPFRAYQLWAASREAAHDRGLL